MNYMLCPVCGDKVVGGKCTFCGYVLTPEEIRNAKYGSDTPGATLNQSKTSYNQSINECKGHSNHNINKELDNLTDTIGEKMNQAANIISDKIAGFDSNYRQNTYNQGAANKGQYNEYVNNGPSLNALKIIAIILIFINPVISIALCIFGMIKSDDYYKSQFKTVMIIDIILISFWFIGVILLFIIGLASSM